MGKRNDDIPSRKTTISSFQWSILRALPLDESEEKQINGLTFFLLSRMLKFSNPAQLNNLRSALINMENKCLIEWNADKIVLTQAGRKIKREDR